jgi:chemotaxis protein methyltransferase CheR
MTRASSAIREILEMVGERTGLSFPPGRLESAELAIGRAMDRARTADPQSYKDMLVADASSLDDLIIELTIGETYFFREPAQFQFIRRVVLPDIDLRRGSQHPIRAWSAACASGEEAYSLAILLAEEGVAERANVLATDISRAALAKARRASYQDWSLRGEAAKIALRYLHGAGNRRVLDQSIRAAVNFRYLNLARDVYPSFETATDGMDLILCRNVLIYFDPATVRAVVGRLFDSLAPGGWLVTASSDPPLDQDSPFEVVVAQEGVFYRKPLSSSLALVDVGRLDHTEPEPLIGTAWSVPGTVSSVLPTHNTTAPDRARIDEAIAAFYRGEYAKASELTGNCVQDTEACVLRVMALANVDSVRAEYACAEAVRLYPLSAEIHHLHAVLLLASGRVEQAAKSARSVVYLDRTLVFGHFTLGTILWQAGDVEGARRAFRNAHDLCASLPDDRVVPLSGGETAGRLRSAAAARFALPNATAEVSR